MSVDRSSVDSLSADGRIWAVVPAKGFGRAKSRLGEALPAALRSQLAESLLRHVLDVLTSVDQLAGVLVLSDDPHAKGVTAAYGAELLLDEKPARLGAIVDGGLRALEAKGVRGALVLMGDLPLLSPGDIQHLLGHMQRQPVVLAADVAQAGTNALGLAQVNGFRSCFGNPDSLLRHQRAADARGLAARVVLTPGLARDLDEPEQLREMAHWPLPPRLREFVRHLPGGEPLQASGV